MNILQPLGIMLALCTAQTTLAAVSLDRTRVIFTGADKSVSLGISNQNAQLPYLAQAWLENEHAEKIGSPLVVVPPIQRLEAGSNSQVKIQGLPALAELPQDRESLFYFNLREIPPRSDKPNTLQIALQTRVKLFYRPAAIATKASMGQVPWQERLTLIRQGDAYRVNNPTPYYVTLIDAARDAKAGSVSAFKPLMVAPGAQQDLGLGRTQLGDSPVLTYVNDYGGRPRLSFTCAGDTCTASPLAGSQ
ncbi:chaperone protein PapD [Pseudomonas sp. TE6288]|uniref:fimbria/pilus periplasmic chaperone n=1 Tax=unclassified Pseudomonas TaxID=196821 RepID=UPI000C88AFBE|nr:MULTISPECIES: fimbria/pilus periplasmic chaperone [unclassified Pseudomonas]PNA02129.1 molecular chaperone [Pseudomonas sp. FW305-42]PNA23047.1 molecular chaperone [Pseudomonas sp. MPR-R1B]PNB28386.1 molecular chaperone [Pseudomonas sp. DP16D-E2]PNB44739.1 molecular chaperone [Pseudomonas sp. FW305-17]PNB64194.1 molecular chaperone [Pseudomonas sp. GW531-E2]